MRLARLSIEAIAAGAVGPADQQADLRVQGLHTGVGQFEGQRVGDVGASGADKVLFYGEDGDLAGQDKESQEASMLALHLLQSALVHVNTLLIQQVLADEKWVDTLTEATGGRCPRSPTWRAATTSPRPPCTAGCWK
jgi:hypothetical protein